MLEVKTSNEYRFYVPAPRASLLEMGAMMDDVFDRFAFLMIIISLKRIL